MDKEEMKDAQPDTKQEMATESGAKTETTLEEVISPKDQPVSAELPLQEEPIIREKSTVQEIKTKPEAAGTPVKSAIGGYLKIILPLCAILLLIAGMFLLPADAVVETQDGTYYKSRIVFSSFGHIVQMRDPMSMGTLDAAKSSINKNSLSIDALASVKRIHFSDGKSSVSATEPVATQGNNPFDVRFIGKYKVLVGSHSGFLFLSVKNGYLFGGLQFPKWGNGVYEPLKQLSVSNGKISFVRSATTADELRKTGAGSYFTQKYTGDYSKDGKFITGIYTSTGARQTWKGERL